MSTRLTNDMRDIIRAALLDHRFKAEIEKLEAEATAIGPDLYAELMGEWAVYAAKLPQNFMHVDYAVKVDIPGVECHFSYKCEKGTAESVLRSYCNASGRHCYPLPETWREPNNWPYELRKDSHVYARIVDVNLRAQQLKKARQEMAEKLEATLNAFKTVKALVEAWPEVAPFVPGKSASAFLPAVPTAELNKALGLP